jgi:hypothetical protein
MLSRAEFLRTSVAVTAGMLFGQRLRAAEPAREKAVHLKGWQIVDMPGFTGKSKQVMKITADNGAWGVSRLIGGCKDLKDVEQIGRRISLLDHEAMT